jgi:hypothetical protein
MKKELAPTDPVTIFKRHSTRGDVLSILFYVGRSNWGSAI